MANQAQSTIPEGISWEIVRGSIGTTEVGYLLADLDRWWVVASGEPLTYEGNEPGETFEQYGYLHELDFDPGEGPPGPLWGELFFDSLCYTSQAEANQVANLVSGRAINLGDVTRIDHWMCGYPGAALPRRKSAQWLVEYEKPRRVFGPDYSGLEQGTYVPAYCYLCHAPATRPGGNKGKGSYTIKHKPSCRAAK